MLDMIRITSEADPILISVWQSLKERSEIRDFKLVPASAETSGWMELAKICHLTFPGI